ncbi:MAG: DNA repair protein RadC [Pseudomonadota bacterium]
MKKSDHSRSGGGFRDRAAGDLFAASDAASIPEPEIALAPVRAGAGRSAVRTTGVGKIGVGKVALGAAGAGTIGAGGAGGRSRRTPHPGEVPHYHNHRARLRARFLEAGGQALADYEMLELVLFRAIPRLDVKPLAKRLIKAFGDYNGAITAPPARLAEIQGMGDAAIAELKIVEAAAQRLARARALGRDAISSWQALIDYCTTAMAHRDTEQFRVLFLDRKNMLIADEAQGEGTVDHVPVYPREVVKRGLALNASALILVHNHPSGDPAPSRADVEMTRAIEDAARAVGLTLHDHVVIGREEQASFRALGLL